MQIRSTFLRKVANRQTNNDEDITSLAAVTMTTFTLCAYPRVSAPLSSSLRVNGPLSVVSVELNGVGRINEVITVRPARVIRRGQPFAGIPYTICNQPPGSLSLVISAGWETSTGQGPLAVHVGFKERTKAYLYSACYELLISRRSGTARGITQLYLPPTRLSTSGMNHACF